MSEVPPEIDPREFAKKLREHRETQPQGIVQKAADAARQEIRQYRRREQKELSDEELDEILMEVDRVCEATLMVITAPLDAFDPSAHSDPFLLDIDRNSRKNWNSRFRLQRNALVDRIERLFREAPLDGSFLAVLRTILSFAEVVLSQAPACTWDSDMFRVGFEERMVRWRDQLSQAETAAAGGSHIGERVDAGPDEKQAQKLHPATLAMAILFQEPGISPTELADRVGVSRGTLYSNSAQWKGVALTLRAKGKGQIRAGRKTKDGDVEAIDTPEE